MLFYQCNKKNNDKWDITSSKELEGIYAISSFTIEITPAIAKALNFIVSADIKKVFSFRLSDSEALLFSNVCEKYFITHIDRQFSSLEFYKKLSN